MHVAEDLGYRHRPPNAVQRLGQRLGSTRFGAWSFSKLLAPTDRMVHRLTRGRTSAPSLLAGLPVLIVTTTGRRSGEPRTTPLIAVPVDGTLALLGTNFGQRTTPAWVHNLEADPRVHVAYGERHLDLRARPASEAEAADVWAASRAIYGGYQRYRERISGRAVRIFVLEPIDPGS